MKTLVHKWLLTGLALIFSVLVFLNLSLMVSAACPNITPGYFQPAGCNNEECWEPRWVYDTYDYSECAGCLPGDDEAPGDKCPPMSCGIGYYGCVKSGIATCCKIDPNGDTCESSAPSCGGSCSNGETCRARSSAPNECTCNPPGGGDCIGGWVDTCHDLDAQVIVRGLQVFSVFEFEFRMAMEAALKRQLHGMLDSQRPANALRD